jgi:hypothetical protein
MSAVSGNERKYELSECRPPALQDTEFKAVIACELDWVNVIEPHAAPNGRTNGRCGLGSSVRACVRLLCA